MTLIEPLSVATFLNTASAFNDARFSLIAPLTVVAEVFKDAAPISASNSLIDATTVDLFVVVRPLIVPISASNSFIAPRKVLAVVVNLSSRFISESSF